MRSLGIFLLGIGICWQADGLAQGAGQAAKEPLSYTPATVQSFWSDLEPLEPREAEALGIWKSKVLAQVPLNQLRRATTQKVALLMDAAAGMGMSSIEFFSDPAWRTPDAVFLSRAVLEQTHKAFDAHAIFDIETKDVDGKPVKMEWLILGNNRLIIKYDRACKIFHPDYNFQTGKYDYYRYFEMHVGLDRKNQRGVFKIKGANEPTAELEPLVGPFNAAIKNFVIVGGGKLRCDYEKFWVDNDQLVPLIPIERREDDAAKSRDASTGSKG